MIKISNKTRFLIRKALKEDIGGGDVTTNVLIPPSLRGTARIDLKSKGILAGTEVAKEVFLALDRKLKVAIKIKDGKFISRPAKILEIRGRISSILKAERTALNFLGHLSGVATLTSQFVKPIKGTKAAIYDTRKTTPLWRGLEKYAVTCGGGRSHRFGLWDEVLVKDNHWQAIYRKLNETKCRYFMDRMKRVKKSVPIEIEVDSLAALKHLLTDKLRINRILLDNFTTIQLKKGVSMIRRFNPRIKIEASGGIHLRNVKQIARTGVDRISIGALTHSAPALDFSLSIEKIN